MLRGDQFIKHLLGNLEVDNVAKDAALKEFKEKYPFADIETSSFTVIARAKCVNNLYFLCMICGKPLTSRTNQYFKNGVWQQMKKKNNLSNHECKNCNPGSGSQPLAIYQNVAKD